MGEGVADMRFVIGPLLIILGTYVAVRPTGYAGAMARWMKQVVPSSRFLPADGNPTSYVGFARFAGAFFAFGGVMILLHGL